jgi:hypothetical protein
MAEKNIRDQLIKVLDNRKDCSEILQALARSCSGWKCCKYVEPDKPYSTFCKIEVKKCNTKFLHSLFQKRVEELSK